MLNKLNICLLTVSLTLIGWAAAAAAVMGHVKSLFQHQPHHVGWPLPQVLRHMYTDGANICANESGPEIWTELPPPVKQKFAPKVHIRTIIVMIMPLIAIASSMETWGDQCTPIKRLHNRSADRTKYSPHGSDCLSLSGAAALLYIHEYLYQSLLYCWWAIELPGTGLTANSGQVGYRAGLVRWQMKVYDNCEAS